MQAGNLQGILSEAAQSFAAKTAIEWRGQLLTYAELETRTNKLANYLISKGLGKGSVIAVLLGDRIRFIETIIAVLKAGCAFAPLNADNPDKRLRLMIEAIEPSLFIIEEESYNRLSGLSPASHSQPEFLIVNAGEAPAARDGTVTDTWDHASFNDDHRPVVSSSPDDMCYIYFTSGSTGIPKAIAGRLKSLLHFVTWEIKTFAIDHGWRVSQMAAPTFDASLRDIFVPLSVGATICVPDGTQTLIDSQRLFDWIDGSEINLMHCVPSIFRSLLKQDLDPQRLGSLRYIVMAGEKLFPSEVRQWIDVYGERIQLVNLYGATENTMAKFCHFITKADASRSSVPIGKPIDGAKAIILDSAGEACDPGIMGEICIRTPFLTLGYYNDPELTSQVFVQNPFSSDPRDIIHKTGDCGRLLPDGNYELIGRKDHQVKLRGQRVELGEIESVLKRHPGVHESVVMIWGEEPDNQRLAAYVVAQPETDLSISQLQNSAREFLPDYMVPTDFMLLQSLPLLANGKIDRGALPEPDKTLANNELYVAPTTDMQERLAAIWSEVLGVEKVGIFDNFFHLGGHSLLVTRVISRVREEFHVEIPLKRFFERPIIDELASAIEQIRGLDQEEQQLDILDMVEGLSEEEMAGLLEQLSETEAGTISPSGSMP